MTDIPNANPDMRSETLMDAPDKQVSARELFGVDVDMMVPAFSEADERVPDLDPAYVFDADTTLAILAGFAFNRRVMVQGYHGTGKSTHIEQVAARLNWPCIRINLDSHISRIDLCRQGRHRAERGPAGDGVPRGAAALGVAAAGGSGVR
jgi:cobaltochelatase CobS